MLRDGMKVLLLGVCPEADFPYDISRFTEKPSAAEADAGKYKIVSYHRVRSLRELKTCLHHGHPITRLVRLQLCTGFECNHDWRRDNAIS